MIERSRHLSDELRFEILRLLQAHPELTQRELAERLSISLGKVNYCLRALAQKGLIKARNFRNSRRKLRYAYYLTPPGIQEKARLTVAFLKVKLHEVETLRKEIAELQRECRESTGTDAEGASPE